MIELVSVVCRRRGSSRRGIFPAHWGWFHCVFRIAGGGLQAGLISTGCSIRGAVPAHGDVVRFVWSRDGACRSSVHAAVGSLAGSAVFIVMGRSIGITSLMSGTAANGFSRGA